MSTLNITITTTAPNENAVIGRLKLSANGTINWGDGNTDNLTAGTTYNKLTHNYVSAGVHSVVVTDSDDITEIILNNNKISNFDTSDLSGADIYYFICSNLGTGCIIDSSDMTGWTGHYWQLNSMLPAGTYNIDTSDMTGWTGYYWRLGSMPAGTYNIDTSVMTGWTGHYWQLYSMPAGTYNIDTSDMTGWTGYSWLLNSMPAGTYNIDTSDMTGWTGYYWRLYSMPAGTYNIDTSDMTGWIGYYWQLYSMPAGTYNISSSVFQLWESCDDIFAYDCIDSATGENVFTQEIVDRIINDIWEGKLRYGGSPSLDIGGTNATPSAKGLAQIAELEAGEYQWNAYSYNLNNGFDRYTDDATGLVTIDVPYVSGVPVVSSITGYTKQSERPVGQNNMAWFFLKIPEMDRSNATIFNATCRASVFYDSSNPTLWHSSEFNIATLTSYLNAGYKNIAFIADTLNKYDVPYNKTGETYDVSTTGDALTKSQNFLIYSEQQAEPTLKKIVKWIDTKGRKKL